MKTSGDGGPLAPLVMHHLVGLRHSELGEGVKDEASDCGLRFLPFDGSCGQVWSKDGFESEHGGFGEASSCGSGSRLSTAFFPLARCVGDCGL